MQELFKNVIKVIRKIFAKVMLDSFGCEQLGQGPRGFWAGIWPRSS